MPKAAKNKGAVKGVNKSGLSFASLSRLGNDFGIPVLAGMTEENVGELPNNTIFAAVTDQHWILGIKGENKTLIFDSLGLPPLALRHVCHDAEIIPWNKFGYQSMFSSVCGYYIVAALLAIKHGNMVYNGNIDRIFQEICPHHVPRPENMAEWYSWHRTYNEQLMENDRAIVDYVGHVYPRLNWLDAHAPHLGSNEVHTGVLGSPIYAHAGIHAPSVAQKFGAAARARNAVDPQRSWPGLGQETVASFPGKLQVENSNTLAFATAATDALEKAGAKSAAARTMARQSLHVAGPVNKNLTNQEKVLWSRAALNAYVPPSGVTAEGNDGNIPPPNVPENVAGAAYRRAVIAFPRRPRPDAVVAHVRPFNEDL